jgi:uncharacterized iron-regulated membrane protein
MKFRPLVFWLHVCAGVIAGVVVLIMSVTGVLLTYEKQMIAWAERSPLAAPPSPDARRLPIDQLLAGARTVRPGATPATVTIRADPDEPVSLGFGREDQLLVNAYTGAVLGEGATSLRAFFRSVTEWHRYVAASGEYRSTGKAITGASNLAFLVLVLTGAYLWLPAIWSRAQLRNILWFRRGLAGKARDFNWHNTIGVWSFLPLVIVVASATVISYPWASNLAYRVMGEEPPPSARRSPQGEGGPSRRGLERAANAAPDSTSLNPRLAQAERHVEGWRTITLRVPANDRAPLVFTIDSGSGGEPQKRGTLTLDAASGALVAWEPFSSNSPGRRLRSILRFAHTGEVLGIPGQTIAGIASAGGVFLVYTGLALSLRRFLAWRKRRGYQSRRAAA